MWRCIVAVLISALFISSAFADSTKQMPQHDLLTTGAADDTVWVYDTSASSLKRMTVQELIQDYLGVNLVGLTNQVLRNDGAGGVDWSDFASVSGTGTTTYDTDSGSAQSLYSAGANRVGIVGGGSVAVSGSGNTITVTGSGVTVDALTAYTDASAFTGASGFALQSDLTSYTEEVDAGVSLVGTSPIGTETTEVVYGGVSKYFVYSGVTLNGDMLAGGMLFCHGAAPVTLGIPAFSGSTGYFGVWDMTGAGVTVQTTDGDPLYNSDESGTALFVNAGNSRHSAAFTLNAESGSCVYVVTLSTNGNEWFTQ